MAKKLLKKYKYFPEPRLENATIRLYKALERAGGPEKFKHIAKK